MHGNIVVLEYWLGVGVTGRRGRDLILVTFRSPVAIPRELREALRRLRHSLDPAAIVMLRLLSAVGCQDCSAPVVESSASSLSRCWPYQRRSRDSSSNPMIPPQHTLKCRARRHAVDDGDADRASVDSALEDDVAGRADLMTVPPLLVPGGVDAPLLIRRSGRRRRTAVCTRTPPGRAMSTRARRRWWG